jgi:tetratricopeptide (TPR) repeat protein
MRFFFSVPVWGNNHTDLFINVGLPSLLAPGNIPGLRETGECRFFIHTRAEDEARLAGAPSLQRLARLMPVEIRFIRDPVVNPYITMSDCHREIMRLAVAQDVPAVFPSPDHVWGDGSMVRMERLAEAGKTAIHLAGVRLDRDSFVKQLAAWRSVDGTLVIPPRELVKLALVHRHRIAQLHFWDKADADVGDQLNPSNLFWLVGNDGLVAHCFHLHPLMVRAEVRDIDFSGTIDDDLVSRACPDFSRQYVVPDSDEIVNFEISGPDHSIPASCRKGSIPSVCHWAIFQTNRLHRHLFQQTIKLHFADLSDRETKKKFDFVERKASEVVKTVSALNRAPMWRLLVWYPSIFKARLDKISAVEATAATRKYEKYYKAYQLIYPILRYLRVVDLDIAFYVARGERRRRAGRPRAALVDFILVLRHWPDDVGTWSRSFMARIVMGDCAGALKDINTALSLSPRDVNLVAQHAEVAQYLRMWDAALSDYEVIRAAKPDRPDLSAREAGLHAAWADSLVHEGSFDAALEHYATALQKHPDNVNVLARRINAKLRLCDLAGALADLNAAIALAPNEINFIAQRASVAHRLELWDVALADYDVAIAARPGATDLQAERKAAHDACADRSRNHVTPAP